jgi:hypothetical protein
MQAHESNLGDGCIESIDLIDAKAQQEAMVSSSRGHEGTREAHPAKPSPADQQGWPVLAKRARQLRRSRSPR